MKAAPIPDNEDIRMAALHRARLLDNQADPPFDSIVRCAAQATGAPIALISLIDSERQWFLSKAGLEAPETPRDVSFCGHAVAAGEPVVVNNSRSDKRFFDNPLVNGPPHVMAYLGAPIFTRAGAALGTVCVIDNEPRDWREADIAVLKELASVAGALIDARTARLGLQDILDGAPRLRGAT